MSEGGGGERKWAKRRKERGERRERGVSHWCHMMCLYSSSIFKTLLLNVSIASNKKKSQDY